MINMCEQCENNGITRVELKREVGMQIESEYGSNYYKVDGDKAIMNELQEDAKTLAAKNPENPIFVYSIETLSDRNSGEIYRRTQEAFAKLHHGGIVYFAGIETPSNPSNGLERKVNPNKPDNRSEN